MDLNLATPDSSARKRRAYFKREFKQKLVALCQVGDKSISSIARDHGVHVNLLFRWIREFGEPNSSDIEQRLLPVSVTDDDSLNTSFAQSTAPGSPSRNRTGMDGSIILTTRNGCSLQIVGRPDDELLRRVLQMAFA